MNEDRRRSRLGWEACLGHDLSLAGELSDMAIMLISL
jgi:hypothetical protein